LSGEKLAGKAAARPQPGQDFEREQYLYLTTRGRKSGEAREIEIWFTHRDGRFYVIAEYETSHWLQNIRAYPEVQVRVGGGAFSAQGRALFPEKDSELNRIIQELSRKKYGWGDGVVVELNVLRSPRETPPLDQK
jgi:deazaflavin-dependent oxidoreductase (nitroreductase family)